MFVKKHPKVYKEVELQPIVILMSIKHGISAIPDHKSKPQLIP